MPYKSKAKTRAYYASKAMKKKKKTTYKRKK